mgnify:CR=1 FL=1
MAKLINIVLALCEIGAVLAHGRKSPLKIVLRYFTAQSNVLCAVAAIMVAVFGGQGSLVLKYVGTAAVTVTMLTVLLFLGPNIGYKPLLSGPDLWLHLICPILAIASYVAWDGVKVGPWVILVGMLPVLLYGILYLYKAVYIKKWDDFYGFNREGKWPLSFIAMMIGMFVISAGLWMAR